MKRTLLLSTFVLLLSGGAIAQDKAYAITGQSAGNFNWSDLREIDVSSGSVTKVLFESQKYQKGEVKIDLTTPMDFMKNYVVNSAAGTFNSPIAAAAYDKKYNRLYFSSIFSGEFDYLDLNAKTTHFVITGKTLLPRPANGIFNEEDQVTRMTMGADGNGYALTNDANHLIKFTTGKKIVVSDLGALVDASSNDHISIHNKCSCWGGDIVADALGNLYLFTAAKNVFKINIDKRIATYIGSVTGLSGAYTLNGAAVDNDDNVIISSANTFEGFYKVNMKDLAATKLNTTGQVYNASDLANGNLLFASQLRNTVGIAPLIQREIIGNQFISIYPNPAIGSEFKVTFDNKLPGEYNIILTDIQGKTIFSKQVYIKSAGQVETIQLKSHRANGMYMIKITNSAKKPVFSDKIIFD